MYIFKLQKEKKERKIKRDTKEWIKDEIQANGDWFLSLWFEFGWATGGGSGFE